MSSFSMNGDVLGLIDWLDQVEQRVLDTSPLAQACRTIMTDANRAARIAGVDRNGNRLAPLRGGRPLTPAEIRRRGGDGPPLAPRGEGSRVVTDFEVGVETLSGGDVLLRGTWPTFGLIIAIHAVGGGRLPVRDIVGDPIPPSQLADAAYDFAESVVRPVV